MRLSLDFNHEKRYVHAIFSGTFSLSNIGSQFKQIADYCLSHNTNRILADFILLDAFKTGHLVTDESRRQLSAHQILEALGVVKDARMAFLANDSDFNGFGLHVLVSGGLNARRAMDAEEAIEFLMEANA